MLHGWTAPFLQTRGEHRPGRQRVRPFFSRMLIPAIVLGAIPAVAIGATIIGAAKADGHFAMLLKAGETAGVSAWLQSPGPITVFAPDDAAFAKIPKAMRDDLMKPENRLKLKLTIGNHAVAGLVTRADIEKGLAAAPAISVPAMNGMPLVLKRDGGVLTVNGARVTKGPMKVDNGLVYVIDAVLLPPMPIQPRL